MKISITKVLIAVLCVFFLFGSILYIFGDLDNPKIPTVFPLIKDALWIVFCIMIFLFFFKTPINKRYFALSAFFLTLSLIFIVLILMSPELFPSGFLKVFKNLFLYIFIGIMIFGILIKVLPEHQLIFSIHNTLLISLIVSTLFYLFYPLSSVTGRFFGTYGSPNGAGFVASASLMYMFMMIDLRICSTRRIYITSAISFTVLILSSSLSSVGSLIIFLFLYYFIKLLRSKKLYIKKSYLFPFFIFFLASIVLIFQFAQLESIQLITRISAINADNDTVLIRLVDGLRVLNMDCPSYANMPYLLGCQNSDYIRLDSTLFSFAYNFGYLVTILFIFFLYLPILANYYFTKSNRDVLMPSLLAFYFSVIPINLIIQHSFELFPTNIIYSSIIAFSIFYSSN